jgi:hypothetical protein
MPAVQTVYSATLRPGLEGQIATEWGSAAVTEGRLCEVVGGLAFGRIVAVGAGVNGCVLGGALATILGVTIRDVTLIAKAGQTVDRYQQYDQVGILNTGDIWVVALGAAVVAGTVASYLPADGTFAPAATPTTIPGSRWLTTTSAPGQLAAVRLTRAYHTV